MLNFTEKDIEKVSEILNQVPKKNENSWTWSLKNNDNSKPLVFTIYTNIKITDHDFGNLISVQTQHGYYELHNISAYMFFEPDEVIFINSHLDLISCLIIGKQSTCSLYANIKRDTLNSDFIELDPAALLSAMQLSIVENILD